MDYTAGNRARGSTDRGGFFQRRLDKNRRAETPDNSNSPLSEAVRFGQPDVVKYRLTSGADAKSSDGSGHSPKLTELTGGLGRAAIVEMLQA